MRILSLLLLVAAACTPQQQQPPSTTSSLEPPSSSLTKAVITGTARHPLGNAGFADVTISRGDSDCKPQEVVARTTADFDGHYSATVEWKQEPCVIAEATAAGARGVASSLQRRASPPRVRIDLDIHLDPPPPLTRADADSLIAKLIAATNNDDAAATKALAPFFLLHANDDLRAGIEHLRIVHGRITATRLTDERHEDRFDEFVYELQGNTGANTTFRIQQSPRRTAFHPVIQVAGRATRWLEKFVALVAANDPQKLARLLTADDIDYPVAKARRVIDRYRDLATLENPRPLLTGFDEQRSVFRYRIEGRRRDGTVASIPIELGYGDGLLWLREEGAQSRSS